MFNSAMRKFDRDRNRETIPLEGIPLYRIPESDEDFFQRILEKDPDIVFRYHEQRECFDIYYTNVASGEFFWAEVYDPYQKSKMVVEACLHDYYVLYIPTIYEVKRALRGPSGVCKCDE